MQKRRSAIGKAGLVRSASGVIRERWGSPHVVVPFSFADWLHPGAEVEVTAENGLVVIKPRKPKNRPKKRVARC
jgi:hypothetical protein